MSKVEQKIKTVISHAIAELPPGDLLYNTVRWGCVLQGFTLTSLAREMNFSLVYVSDILRGKRRDKKSRIKRIREIAMPVEISPASISPLSTVSPISPRFFPDPPPVVGKMKLQ